MMKTVYAVTALSLAVAASTICPAACGGEIATLPAPAVKSITTVVPMQGGRVDWCHNLDLIAFDRKSGDGYYDVYTMKPDGTDILSLTEDHPDLPNRHIGQPAWHPSGEYIVLQAEKGEHEGSSLGAAPGAGGFNDLWILTVASNEAVLLVEVPNDKNCGVLHPHFSSDGTKLSWSEMYSTVDFSTIGQEFGLWKLRVADFSVGSSGPEVSNIIDYQPLGEGFYENHGFSPDGKKLIFTCNGHLQGQKADMREDICVLDLATSETTVLTSEGYNEHGLFSPDGKWIVWMSDVGVGAGVNGGTDYWIMNADGSGKQRLTWFNDSGHAEYTGVETICADISWSPDGQKFAAYRHMWFSGPEVVLLIELEGLDTGGGGCAMAGSPANTSGIIGWLLPYLAALAAVRLFARRTSSPR